MAWNQMADPKKTMLDLLAERQIDPNGARHVQSALQVSESSIMRLGLEKELVGHTGCVNCLEWNESGTVLASASDDVRFILWDPFRYKRLHIFETGHQGNIFTVKFLPNCQDATIVTGAGDYRVRVHDVVSQETTLVCTCHAGRVKRVATARNLPYMFWSAAEDGVILEYDLRAPHKCTSSSTQNVLVNLCRHLGRNAEAKCLSINAVRPELLAVGANDPYVRLYDRRMIKPTAIQYPVGDETSPRNHFERQQYIHNQTENNLGDGCVRYFVPGHLPLQLQNMKKYVTLITSYLTFSPTGTELLVNLGGEQIYLFDINNSQEPKLYDPPMKQTRPENGRHAGAESCRKASNPRLEARVERLRLNGNSMFDIQEYTSAIRLYNKGVSLSTTVAMLYGNRAAAYMKRKWDGDMYAALRDCQQTLRLDPSHLKAHFRLAKCLHELACTAEADECLKDFKNRFPDHAHSRACKALAEDIQKAQDILRLRREVKENGASTSEENEEERVSDVGHWTTKVKLSDQEEKWRRAAGDYQARFCGHCNTTTDIKEANFFGSEGQFIVAGSDDGSFYIWDRITSNILKVLRGDESIVNCLQPHPSACLLATSGIDPVVRLWSPLPEDGAENERLVEDQDDAAKANQRRMNTDPFAAILLNMGLGIAWRDNADPDPSPPADGNPWPRRDCRQN